MKMRSILLSLLFGLFVVSFASTNALAADKKAAAKAKAATKAKPKPPVSPWKLNLKLGFNGSMAHSYAVPGVDNGFTIGLDLQLNGGAIYKKDQHKWETTLKVLHTQTKTPAVEFFVKTADELNFLTMYSYQFKGQKEASFFTAFSLNTALLPSEYVVSEDKDLIKKGTTEALGKSERTKPFRLTDSFNPTVMQLKAGILVEPLQDKMFEVDMKFSATGQQIIASGFAVEDDDATAQIDLKPLENSSQVGLQFRLEVKGQVNKRVSYEFYADLFYPVLSTLTPDNLQGFDLLNTDISFKVTLSMAAWASINYVFRAQRLPLLSENWQVTNNLVLSLKANIL